MRETTKSTALRIARGDFDRYLKGDGIDVGCGDDPLCAPASIVRTWDKENGDATTLDGIADASLDFVYSSHCLEHLRDVPLALQHWRRVVKPGGFLYVVVPDYTLYEHHCWPSHWNGDHKQSFSLSLPRHRVGRINHWGYGEIRDVTDALGLKPVLACLESDGYDYNVGPRDQTMGAALAQICFVWQRA